MNYQQIANAVDAGRVVHWQHPEYRVIPGPSHPSNEGNCINPAIRYLISHVNGHAIGLTWTDGVTLNGKEADFYVAD